MATAKPLKVRYGWIVVDENKRAIEPLTLHYRVPHYKSKQKAQIAADYYNRMEKRDG